MWLLNLCLQFALRLWIIWLAWLNIGWFSYIDPIFIWPSSNVLLHQAPCCLGFPSQQLPDLDISGIMEPKSDYFLTIHWPACAVARIDWMTGVLLVGGQRIYQDLIKIDRSVRFTWPVQDRPGYITDVQLWITISGGYSVFWGDGNKITSLKALGGAQTQWFRDYQKLESEDVDKEYYVTCALVSTHCNNNRVKNPKSHRVLSQVTSLRDVQSWNERTI